MSHLVCAARDGDSAAWSQLVERFGRLVYSVCRGFRLPPSDCADVSQTVWLRLAENLNRLEHPERVGGWLATTTRRECLALLRSRQRFEPLEATVDLRASTEPGPAETVLALESRHEVAVAFALLTDRCRELLRRVVCDPDVSYSEISTELGMPIGSIGPTRMRCLEKLRRHLAEGDNA